MQMVGLRPATMIKRWGGFHYPQAMEFFIKVTGQETVVGMSLFVGAPEPQEMV